ncbi:signal peptidase I [Crocosphaera sp. XPORK-15E]|uniref:signal peptidase I n=1 Tax=Crocosphaera sp. XPORK-15E TaxID=3110247 RepID=UPI002B21D8D4|nr:signal peptidase I [Crocosphaera sp. XPORK-15E]MEA5533865.1 signal peptidase I [Crocosphaera sp. XPORK-15E]
MSINLDKDPWLAVNFSMFFPGIGQFYAGNYLRGILFLNGQILLLIIATWNIFGAKGNTVTGFICLVIALLVYFGNIVEAYLGVYYPRREQILEKIPRKYKKLWFAIFITRFLPGLGHLYLQKSVIGLILLTASLILLSLNNIFPELLLIPPLIAAIATYHTYRVFPEHSQIKHRIIIIMTGIIFLISVMGNYFPQWLDQRFQKFIIPSESMQPTLQINDIVFVSKSPNYVPQQKDIVVFTPSENIKVFDPDFADYYIKRIIGTPGDIVEVKQGKVYINNQPLQESYIAESPRYQWKSPTIPPNHYIVLGDNRNDSLDSHYWGLLPREVIVGKAYKIGWPPHRIQAIAP